jgi:hypothetical protein
VGVDEVVSDRVRAQLRQHRVQHFHAKVYPAVAL